MPRICWTLAVVFALTTGAFAYKFLIAGKTLTSSDGRVAVQLSAGERDLVLQEMRAFLTALQQILAAAHGNSADAAAAAARAVGTQAQREVPASLVGKLPLSFKRLGFDTHQRFDQLALDIEELGDATVALPTLPALMENCIACHAAYRIDLEAAR